MSFSVLEEGRSITLENPWVTGKLLAREIKKNAAELVT